MSDTIIKVENLSKLYRIGLQEKKADTFAQQMVNLLKYPINNFRKIQNLGKFKDEEEGVHWALKDVNFEVKKGEVLGIIGKNGAGKSTLLKILSKITGHSTGRIEMEGRVAALLEVGTGFHQELTGRENIYMNGTILGMTKREIDQKLDEIIDFSGVEKYIDTPVKFYSSGMRVRLGFSVAAHLEPEILIIDEVLAVGDHEFQKKCLGKIEAVSKSHGRTVLFVSHNMGAIQNLCKNVILLKSGSNEPKIDAYSGVNDYLKNFWDGQESIASNFIEKIEIFDERDLETSYIKCNSTFKVNFYLKEKIDFFSFDFGFFILDREGNKIGSVSTAFKKNRSLPENCDGKLIQFILRGLNLIEGEYLINFSIVKKGKGRIEYVENAKSFQIIQNDFYHSGTILNSHFGKLYIDFDCYV